VKSVEFQAVLTIWIIIAVAISASSVAIAFVVITSVVFIALGLLSPKRKSDLGPLGIW
jgi:hypothetical protein